MNKQACPICAGRGRVHLPRCRIFVDPDATCTCGHRPCPSCAGSGVNEAQHEAVDRVLLEGRCRELLRYPLTDSERVYVRDLLARLTAGYAPILVDWFRSRELLEKYTGPPLNGNGRRRY